jgi:hypothetical protein
MVPSLDALIARTTDAQPILFHVCAWHVPPAELDAMNRQYPGQVSHGLCPVCAARLLQEAR